MKCPWCSGSGELREFETTYNVKQVIDHLNKKAGTRFKAHNRATQRHIRARMAEGYGLHDFIKVIDIKVQEWRHDSTMSKYLRPETLFGNKFDSYLNQPILQKQVRKVVY